MQLLVFLTVAFVAFLVAYALGAGGAVSSLFFLGIFFTGALIRISKPLLDKLKP